MNKNHIGALLVASSLLVGCGEKSPEVQAKETAERQAKIELANKLQEQVTNNTAQIMCGAYASRFNPPYQIISASDGIYKFSQLKEDTMAWKLQNASDIYRTSQDKLVAAKIIRNQECGLDF